MTAHNASRKPQRKYYLGLLLLPALLSLACASKNLPFLAAGTPAPTPTPTEPVAVIRVEVTVISPLRTATPTPTPTATPTPLPAATETVTPAPSPAAVPISPTPPAPVLVNPPVSPVTTPAGAEAAAPAADAAPAPPVAGVSLIDPPNELSLPANVAGLEFKWGYVNGCTVPEGFGFEVRVWPAVTGYGPLGVFDAASTQSLINCDPERGIYKYTLPDLKGAPGVKVTGAGKFLWDVAYVQLKPYQVISTSAPRLFEITMAYSGGFDPFGEDLNCEDFPNWTEAQAVFMAAGGPTKDPHGLDPDQNGTACDELKGQ